MEVGRLAVPSHFECLLQIARPRSAFQQISPCLYSHLKITPKLHPLYT